MQSEVRSMQRVLLRHARDAFGSQEDVGRQWQALNYLERPDFDAACREYDAFAELLERLGTTIEWMGGDDLGLDSMYVRDALGLRNPLRNVTASRASGCRCSGRSSCRAPWREVM